MIETDYQRHKIAKMHTMIYPTMKVESNALCKVLNGNEASRVLPSQEQEHTFETTDRLRHLQEQQ